MTKKEKTELKKLLELLEYVRWNNKNLTNKQYYNIDEATYIVKELLKNK